ncbi:MAG: oxidoreductase, molybdopterin binding [Betaproteobacteria bacterium]|nr:oxidoreductase, molybdopterin binding [Betaproteobacteria bacterium]
MAASGVAMKIRRRYNVTVPPHELTDALTPTEKLFVVYHVGVPEMDIGRWQLAVCGMVRTPIALSFAQLDALPKVTQAAVHECAGSAVNPKVPVRRVAHVEWRGPRLRTVLEAAGIDPRATYVWASGTDNGLYEGTGVHIDCYQKELPLEKALADEVLVATEVNGMPLSENHGAPARLVVPGYYGTNAVKWLSELRLADQRSEGYFAATLYNDAVTENGVESTHPVREIAPHALIIAPAAGAMLAAVPQTIWGRAWGSEEIALVEISTDGGATWWVARLEPRTGFSWQRFAFEWTPAGPGTYQLACRATDRAGLRQPVQGARNEIFRLEVTVGQ